jgi:hypothetical protein
VSAAGLSLQASYDIRPKRRSTRGGEEREADGFLRTGRGVCEGGEGRGVAARRTLRGIM